MRRSKADPAKYARNYRKISQRKMTEFSDDDNDNEQKEIERLKNLLRTSTQHLAQHDQENAPSEKSSNKKRKQSTTDESTGTNSPEETVLLKQEDPQKEVIHDFYDNNNCCDILPARKKKDPKKKQTVQLTPEEIKSAKAKHKAMQRKLKSIEQRREQKKRRLDLYETLSKHALSETEMQLMQRSANVGKKMSKKEMLKTILQKEKAGITLTDEEKSLLYTDRDEVEMENYREEVVQSNTGAVNTQEVVPLAFPSTGRKKKKNNKRSKNDRSEAEEDEAPCVTTKLDVIDETNLISTEKKAEVKVESCKQEEKPKFSFASQLMAGLSTLKNEAVEQKKLLDKKDTEEQAKLEEQKRILEENERKNRQVYIPKNTAVLKSAATMGMKPSDSIDKNSWRILTVNRPEAVKTKRYDLPVSAMEYEIIDSVRNNSVTIICSETGSGKSTQVPQFLYESGFTLGNAAKQGEDDGLLICVTQPRRVAAVSTAKRVCYEMGHSSDNGQTIRSKRGEGNLVAYQTKYESAGVGPKTRVKFMTDGILLQEIKSDLLLRKYAVICLDEIHERGINTDVLLGLLSVALPLRRKAAEEGSLPPLKLVLMSATLRVEDFMNNPSLFAEDPPNLVKVPGRTFPVTVHHSKVTELDDYETAAFQKVCKIHRKLPPGGILVFLTGKQEIVRMVNRLKSSLIPKFDRKTDDNNEQDVQVDEIQDEYVDSSLRDMDDDEADGDLFQNDEDNDDYEDMDETDGQQPIFDQDDNIPKKVKILPLYSLLSVQDQAKVFAPLDENTRLIVVTTNIAETSLTIPGISYVVDTGRQKCRNYHAGTGVASYDVMWISKASADQRAGRAGRTGPGHCYRTYSSSVYSRHLDAFALPEVLSRPLEDVVLAMKSMNISNVGNFPFPTPPDKSQLDAAVKLLANIGCTDVSNIEREGGDGVITKLGAAIAKLPIGVRYGKMLLVAAQGNVLDYGIVMVSVLSEASPFAYRKENEAGNDESSNESDNDSEDMDEVDKNNALRQERQKRKENSNLWRHDGGDILAKVLASGAYAYAGRGSGGASESFACKRFCEENALNPVIMQRIHKMRLHLAKLAKQRLGRAEGIAASTGKILATMSPPTKAQENLLKQAISSGLLDNVARRSPQSRLQTGGAQVSRSAYFSCRSAIQEPLYIDRKSVLYSRDPRQLPEWICYDTLIRKQTKDGSTISTMTNVTPIDPQWLGSLAMGCKILVIGDPLDVPVPSYDPYRDKIMCSVTTKYGDQGWILPPIQMNMDEISGKGSKHVMADDAYRWFARYLLEGKVFDKLKNLRVMLNEDPSIITRKKPSSKVAMLVSALSQNNISSAKALIRYWATKDKTFLFKNLKSWVKKENAEDAKTLWINFVKEKLVESNNL